MARRSQFPPKITTSRGRDRCFANGRYHHLGPTGSEESRAKYAALLAELSSQPSQPLAKDLAKPVTLTVAELVAQFLVHAEKHYSARGREGKQFPLAFRPLLALHRDLPATSFGPKALRAVQGEMVSRQLSRGVINRRIVRIRTAWRWAEAEELVPAGSFHALTTVRAIPKNAPGVRQTPGHLPTSRADLDQVLACCGRIVGAALEVQWLAGMRSGEVRIMRAEDIDRGGPIVDGVQVWLYRPEWHKEEHLGQMRVVPLGAECQRILTALGIPERGYVFPARRRGQKGNSRCYSSNTYAQAVARACERAGVKVTAYGGRHSAKMRITRALGADAARAMLGQKSIQSTTHYGQLDIEHAAQAAAKLG